MKQDNCIFCKLANGDIPTNTIFERISVNTFQKYHQNKV